LDGDHICDIVDTDDDDDGVADESDIWPRDSCAAFDTDSDGIPDTVIDECQTNLTADDDDDGDFVLDVDDFCSPGEIGWISGATLGTDHDGDGCRDDGEDSDDDNDGLSDSDEITVGTDPKDSDTDDDGFNDGVDAFPLNPNEWVDSDGDGYGDNEDAFPNDASKHLEVDILAKYGLVIVLAVGMLVVGLGGWMVMRMRGGGESEEDTPEPNNTDPMEDYVQQLIAQGYPEETARQHAQQYAEHFQKY
jgi:hypothetical protein